MSQIIQKFKIFTKISEDFKTRIKSFDIFDDSRGSNLLFITSDDQVFSFGQNSSGCCGLGHNRPVSEPQLILELSHKKIKQFFIGWGFVLAINENNHLFSWGCNHWGQLGIGSVNKKTFKPQLIAFPQNETLIQISCGLNHTLGLTSKGVLYGWGRNQSGEVGVGRDKGIEILSPTKLSPFSGKSFVKSVYTSRDQSFAITADGRAFSWGSNCNCLLGHQLSELEYVFRPKAIKLSNITSICSSDTNTYFLSTEGLIHFCGQIGKTYQKSPKLMTTKLRLNSLETINDNKNQLISTAIDDNSVYILDSNQIIQTKFKTITELTLNSLQITHKTYEI